MKRVDLILDADNELNIANGDFVLDESKEQDIHLILVSHEGAWKQSPLLGVGINRNISQPFDKNPFLKGRIFKHLEYDDIELERLDIIESMINI
jgi:hypothetical protein